MYNAISPNITKKIAIDDTPIVSASDLGQWLNLSSSAITAHQTLLESLIATATETIEDYSWITLWRTTYEAYYQLSSSTFSSVCCGRSKLALERSPIHDLSDITKIEYLDNDVWVEFDRGTMSIDGLYENTTEKQEQGKYASIYFREEVPFECRKNAYKIRVTFDAGFDSAETDNTKSVSNVIKQAILIIAAFHYTNRGDCSTAGCDMNGFPVPCHAKAMIDKIALSNSTVGVGYVPSLDDCSGDC